MPADRPGIGIERYARLVGSGIAVGVVATVLAGGVVDQAACAAASSASSSEAVSDGLPEWAAPPAWARGRVARFIPDVAGYLRPDETPLTPEPHASGGLAEGIEPSPSGLSTELLSTGSRTQTRTPAKSQTVTPTRSISIRPDTEIRSPVLLNSERGTVAHNPLVYLVWVGHNWATQLEAEALAGGLKSLFDGLSRTAYQGILTQYYDATGHVSNEVTVGGEYTDYSVPAAEEAEFTFIEEEVEKAIGADHWAAGPNVQIQVLLAPGTSYQHGSFTANTTNGSRVLTEVSNFTNVVVDGAIAAAGIKEGEGNGIESFNERAKTITMFKPAEATAAGVPMRSSDFGILGGGAGFCAVHTATAEREGKRFAFSVIPYEGDWPFDGAYHNCGYVSGKGFNGVHPQTATEVAASHEYAEMALGGYETVWASSGHEEIADLCTGKLIGLIPNVSWVEKLWDNYQNECSEEDASPPQSSLASEAATGITPSGAILHGSVTPSGIETTYRFEYGTTSSYGSKTAEASAGSGSGSAPVSAVLSGLAANTTYHYRLVASNEIGTMWGADEELHTPSWSLQSAPAPTGARDSYLRSVSCTSASACTAVWIYLSSAGTWKPLAERWNGSEWTVQAPAIPSGASESSLLGVSCASTTSCEAVGYYKNSAGTRVTLAEKWTGSEWVVQTSPNPTGAKESILYGAACPSATACLASGYYENGSGSYFALTERWNGSEWVVLTTPNPTGATESALYGVACSAANACTAVGYYLRSGSGRATLAERWGGSEWTIQTSPNPTGASQSYFNGSSCPTATACTAVGTYVSSGVDAALAEQWAGGEWTIKTTPSPSGAKESLLNGVSCASSGECVAVGQYKNSAGTPLTLAESWSGLEWTPQTTPDPTGAREALLGGASCASSLACTAVGQYASSTGESLPLAEALAG